MDRLILVTGLVALIGANAIAFRKAFERINRIEDNLSRLLETLIMKEFDKKVKELEKERKKG